MTKTDRVVQIIILSETWNDCCNKTEFNFPKYSGHRFVHVNWEELCIIINRASNANLYMARCMWKYCLPFEICKACS